MIVKLYKKEGTFTDKDTNEVKNFTNFYIECGSELIPVRIPYFKNAKCEGRDPAFQGRFAVLNSFAEPLPEKG